MPDRSLPFPLDGSTLIVGPTNVGKTSLTADAVQAWIDRHGPTGVVILEFGPEIEVNGRLIGRRLDRFMTPPPDAWYRPVPMRGPRTEGDGDRDPAAIAERNAKLATEAVADAPAGPSAVFANDVTLALHHDPAQVSQLTGYCDRARCAVLNAHEGDDLGRNDSISRNERDAVRRLRAWADRTVDL